MPQSPPLRVTAFESRDVIELLSNKWRIAILHLLTKRVLRTHELQSAITEVSPKMLIQTLRGMERDGLVNRMVRPVAPAHVEYALTGMGRSVIQPLRGLCRWAEKHVNQRDAARARFDAAEKHKPSGGHRAPSEPRR